MDIEILNQPGGFEVLWDYCLENDLIMPIGIVFCRKVRKSMSGDDRRSESVSWPGNETSYCPHTYTNFTRGSGIIDGTGRTRSVSRSGTSGYVCVDWDIQGMYGYNA